MRGHSGRFGVMAVVMMAVFSRLPAQAAPAVTLTSSVTILLPANEEPAVRKAAEDLQSDFAKVLGSRPRIVTRAEDAGPLTVMIGVGDEIPAALKPAGATAPESFSISVAATPARRSVVLTGPDKRGAIYAIYQFSQDYLGIDPMYYWTDKQPAKRKSVAIAGDLSRVFPPPVFKYRGFFINDEDLLTGWAPGEKTDHTGIALSVWDKIFETVLRLKGNMIAPGTWIFPTDPQVKKVGERGLIVTQHHATPLGLNAARWPQGVPYNYTTHPEILERAWKNAVASYDPHQEILWTVGLRGLSDAPYASQDPSVVGNDKHQGELISKAIAAQMAIVRAVQPNASFITNLWMEGNRLKREGFLAIPPDVTTVWADSGYGIPHDEGEVGKGQGVYYHVMMYNFRANQLSEMVPVGRVYDQLGRFIKAGATAHFLVNTSDIRPVAMSVKAVMGVAWGGVPQGASDARFYRDWSSYEFGASAAEPVSKVYEQYYTAFPRLPAGVPGGGEEYGDQLYHTEAQLLLLATMVDAPYYLLAAQDPKWTPATILGLKDDRFFGEQGPSRWIGDTLARELKVCAEHQPNWDAVWNAAMAAEKSVAPERKAFYEADVLAMIAFNRDGNHILLKVAEAVRDWRAGDKAKARAAATATYRDFDEIAALEKRAEYGKWKNWYRGEWLDGIAHTRELVDAFIRFMDDPNGTLPPPVLGTHWQGYYHILHYEGDKTVDVH